MASNVREINVNELNLGIPASIHQALTATIGSKTDITEATVDSFSSTIFNNLKFHNPEVLVIDQIGNDGTMTTKIDLSRLGTTLKGTMSAIVFDSDQAVSLKGLSGFAGVISLGDGNNIVSGGNNSQSVAVSTGTGNDSVTTGGGADTVSIGGGRDTISTGSGADTITLHGLVTGGKINSGSGNDVIDLSHYVQGSNNLNSISGGSGDDTLTPGPGPGPGLPGGHPLNVQGSETVISINGGSGTDTLNLGMLSIASVSKLRSTVTITLADGAHIEASNIEKFVYTDSHDVVHIVGVKLFDAEF